MNRDQGRKIVSWKSPEIIQPAGDETSGSKEGLTFLDVFNSAFLCARGVIMA